MDISKSNFVVSTPGCELCDALKEYLGQNKIEYVALDADEFMAGEYGTTGYGDTMLDIMVYLCVENFELPVLGIAGKVLDKKTVHDIINIECKDGSCSLLKRGKR